MSASRATSVLGVNETRLTLDGKPFYFQGLAFQNALYNPVFNQSSGSRLSWLRNFKANGINCVRIFCQWDFMSTRAFADVAADHTMYTEDGEVKDEPWQRLAALIEAADTLGMIIEVSMFAHEKEPYFLRVPLQERAARELTERLRPYGNLIQQIWSGNSAEVMRYFEIIKNTDPQRLVTSAPGYSAEFRTYFDHTGSDVQNKAFDVLTPHTLRSEAVPFWYAAPAQIQYLVDTYRKPVIDDSPVHCGPVQLGGVPGGTKAWQHIKHIERDRKLGGYHTYSHDMCLGGYGHASTPPSGIPDPDFSPFHRQVFDYLRDHTTW
jgi:hypothetical protein